MSLVNAAAGPGRKMTRGATCTSSKTMMLAGAAESAPGRRATNWRVPLSNSAARGWPLSGRTAPAGSCEVGGDTAGWAGSMVGGYPGAKLASGFEEQPATRTDNINRPMKRR